MLSRRWIRSEIRSTIIIDEAKANLPDLIHRLSHGSEIMITENNEVVARLVGERRPAKQRPWPGLCKRMITIVAAAAAAAAAAEDDDDDEHLKNVAEYMP